MTKAFKKRKQATEPAALNPKKLRQNPAPQPATLPAAADSIPQIGGLIYSDELDTTTDTLNILAQNPSLIHSKALKGFRTAVHDYWRVAAESSLTGSSLTSRVSAALVDQRHVDALVLLSEMVIREQGPKLGALQRWVRECDAVLTPGTSQEEENRVWQILDAILRTTQPDLVSRADSDVFNFKEGTRLRWFTPFTISPTLPETEVPPLDSDAISDNAAVVLQPLQTTRGADRRPPNKYPAIIYFGPLNTFPLLPTADRTRKPSRHDVPGVPGAFVINDVFERFECESLVKTAEKIGLEPDEPISGSAVELASVLAHNLIWLADTSFLEILYSRVKDFLPQSIQDGAVKCINGRFRLYRYRPGALYRPHIDGAWPASALKSANPPSYIYDSDPSLYSRLTFLIYLNDDFEGGCTTFFLPSPSTGILEARPVKPRIGSVCVFPHGATKGSLLHEGSGVIGDGVKYIIRTEVLYEVDRKDRTETQKE